MITEKDIAPSAQKALKILNEHGVAAYVVGGAVRDIIMGMVPKDYDIASSASPCEILEFFSGFKAIETGLRFGTVTVIIDESPIEITSFRTDGEYLNNRSPENVVFSKNIETDLARRDFTVNAMAYSPYLGFVDLFNGIGDIKSKTLRAIGNPYERFNEDALRILRALRFSACLGFTIEENTKRAMFKNKNLLLNISSERIREEFNRIITGKAACPVLFEYRDIIGVFIPEIIRCFDFDQKSKHHIYDIYMHTLKALENCPDDLNVRLAVFFHDIAKPLCFTEDESGNRHYKGHPHKGEELAKNILRRLKYDNKTVKAVTTLIEYHDTCILPEKSEVKRYLKLLGKELLQKLFQVKFADSSSKAGRGGERYKDAVTAEKLMHDIIKNNECYRLKDLAICGRDLLNENIPKELIGSVLDAALEQVITEKLPNEKGALSGYASEYCKNINF